jgi:hypothetical protein
MNQPRPGLQPLTKMRIVFNCSGDIHAVLFLSLEERSNLLKRPIHSVAELRLMKDGAIANGLPNRTQQTPIRRSEEKQRKDDILQDAAWLAQILLQQVCPGKFNGSPSAGLTQHAWRDEKHRVPAFQNPIPQRFKGSSPAWVIMAIEPRDNPDLSKCSIERKNEPSPVLTAV